MSNTLLITLAVVALLAQTGGIALVVRWLVMRWTVDAFKAGVEVGQQKAGIEASEPYAEAYKIGHDIGIERGHQDALTDEALADLTLEDLERLTSRLFHVTSQRYDARNEESADCGGGR